MASKKTSTNNEKMVVEIPKIDIRFLTITVEGDTPLIMHKWSEKAKKQILDNETGKPKTKKHEIKNPVADFINSMYWLEGEPAKEDLETEESATQAFINAIQNGARFGFPSVAFKEAAVAAGYRAGVIKNMVTMRGAFHIDDEFVEIHGTPEMREDMVVVGGQNRSADIRHRGQFKEWSATFEIKYNAGVVTPEQLASLFNIGGFACGIGEWRIEKGGQFGAFHVV